jgi:hypothetical protein
MRRFRTALVTAGIIATAVLITASTADAQWGWRGNWRVGGDYYYPSDYSYGSAPLYDYGSLPTYGSVATVAPMQTIETIETVRTIRPAARLATRREIVTRQTTIRDFATNTYAQPLYSYAGSAAMVSAPAYGQTSNYDYGTSYARPLYNTVATPAIAAVAAPVITEPAYRYVYQWDRILVVDPSTNIVVQALPHELR